MHRGAGDLQNFPTAVPRSPPDPGALTTDAPPAALGTQIAEPERKCAALMGANRIDPASLIKEEATAGVVFADAVTVFIGVKIIVDESIQGQFQMGGDGIDFRLGDVYRTRFAHTAIAALPAFETDALVEKIGPPFQRLEKVTIHART